jgi:DNA-binding transcriptional LysR family regulator
MKHVKLESIEVHEYGPGRLEIAIAEGKVDIGITYLPVPKAGIEFAEVAQVRMGVFGLAERFRSREFHELPFVIPLLPAEGAPSKVMGLDGWPDHKIERKVKYRVTMMASAIELCRKGHAVAYLPEFVVCLHNEDVLPSRRLSELKSPVPAKERSQSVFLVQRKGSGESLLYRQVANCLRSLT